MNAETSQKIKILITKKISEKLLKYKAETNYKPFFEAMFNKEIVTKASIMQSLYTSFGMSIYEQMAVILAHSAGYICTRQHRLLGSIDNESRLQIDKLCENPIREKYSKEEEINLIRDKIKSGEAAEHPDSTVDVYLEKSQGTEYYIDITTVKPNKKEARTLRRKMLVWAALRLSQNPQAKIKTCIGIPYNPYYPKKYNRPFVINNTHSSEVLVQNDLWELFAGFDVFDEILIIFNDIGNEMNVEINDFLK